MIPGTYRDPVKVAGVSHKRRSQSAGALAGAVPGSYAGVSKVARASSHDDRQYTHKRYIHDPRYEPVHTRACKPWHVHGRRGLDPWYVHERQVTIAVHTRASRYAAACLVRRINFPTLHLSPSLR